MADPDEITKPLKALPADLAAPAPGFDVARLVADGKNCEWSREQFAALPLVDRVRLLAGGQVRFFRKGVEVPAREAVRGL